MRALSALTGFLLVLAADVAAGDCTAVIAGNDTVGWNSTRRTFLGKALGQTFYAADTLITRITVWRAPNNLLGAIDNRLFVTTVATVNYVPPKPITQGILQNGPAVFVIDSDPPGLPIRMDYVLDPPLALPHPGTFAFFIQREGCDAGETSIIAKEPGTYPYGTHWITGRTVNLPCYLAAVDAWEDLDLCFERPTYYDSGPRGHLGASQGSISVTMTKRATEDGRVVAPGVGRARICCATPVRATSPS